MPGVMVLSGRPNKERPPTIDPFHTSHCAPIHFHILPKRHTLQISHCLIRTSFGYVWVVFVLCMIPLFYYLAMSFYIGDRFVLLVGYVHAMFVLLYCSGYVTSVTMVLWLSPVHYSSWVRLVFHVCYIFIESVTFLPCVCSINNTFGS